MTAHTEHLPDDPTLTHDSPTALAEDTSLPRRVRKERLRAWRDLTRQEIRATDEGMDGPTTHSLQEVDAALATLEDDPTEAGEPERPDPAPARIPLDADAPGDRPEGPEGDAARPDTDDRTRRPRFVAFPTAVAALTLLALVLLLSGAGWVPVLVAAGGLGLCAALIAARRRTRP